jgi:iron complex outermembrane recepter protein
MSKNAFRLILATTVSLLAIDPAQAQDAPVEAGLGDIIVTAQRRNENLQDVPIAITSVSAVVSEKLGISDLQNLPQLVPSFTFQRQASGSTPFIRGVGSTSSFVGNEPSVAIFVDDVYVPTGNAAVFEFNSIENVEVLKGPQGTLFGRNATGGVIHVHTRTPSDTPTMDFSVGYGNYDTVKAQAYVSSGLSSNISASVAGFYTYQGKGWGRNIVTGNKAQTNKSWGLQGKLHFQIGEASELLLNGTIANRRSDQGFATQQSLGFRGLGGYNPITAGAGFYDSTTTRDQYANTDFRQVSGKFTTELGGAKLVSITGYSRTTTLFEIDLDRIPTDILGGVVDNNAKTFTQELQLLSPTDRSFKWIVGGFYLRDNSFFGLDASGLGVSGRFPGGFHQFVQSRQKTSSISGFAQASYELASALTVTAGLRYTSDKRTESEGGASIALPNGTVFTTPTGARLIAGPFGSSKTFNALTGRFSLDYKVTDDILVYAAYNRGFKSGVYNLPGYSVTTRTPLPPVNPEKLDAYTAGFKSEFLDRRVRLNAEGFYYKFSNIQVQNNVPPPNAGTILVNAGKATIKGFEVDLSTKPTNNLTLTASFSYLDGKYDEFLNGPTFFPTGANAPISNPAVSSCSFASTQTFNAAGYPIGAGGAPAVQGFCNLSGSKTVNTPPFSSAIALLYNLPTQSGDFDLAASWSHSGNYFSEPHNLSFIKQPKYDVVNTSLSWTDPDGHLKVKLWANNITEAEYFSYLALGATAGATGAPAAPRTFGVTFSAHF